MKKVKYVATRGYYLGCPSHDAIGTHTIVFYRSLKELMTFMAKNMHEYEFSDEVFSTKTGRVVAGVSNSLSTHGVTGLELTLKMRAGHVYKYHLVDDGRGNKVWKRKD